MLAYVCIYIPNIYKYTLSLSSAKYEIYTATPKKSPTQKRTLKKNISSSRRNKKINLTLKTLLISKEYIYVIFENLSTISNLYHISWYVYCIYTIIHIHSKCIQIYIAGGSRKIYFKIFSKQLITRHCRRKSLCIFENKSTSNAKQ